jgi:hypothetical protein
MAIKNDTKRVLVYISLKEYAEYQALYNKCHYLSETEMFRDLVRKGSMTVAKEVGERSSVINGPSGEVQP